MTESKPDEPTNVIYETVAEDQVCQVVGSVDSSLYRQSEMEIKVKENPAYGKNLRAL